MEQQPTPNTQPSSLNVTRLRSSSYASQHSTLNVQPSTLNVNPSPLTVLPSPLTVLPLKDSQLPPIIREVVTNAPDNRKLPSFIACLAPLCALATRIRLNYYYDGTRQSQLLLQVIIEAPQSSGKQFAADIERLIMDNTLKAHDQQQRRLEQEYREKKKRRKANEKLEEEPKTTIRIIPPTISKTVLVKRADFYERILGDVLTFWMFAEELAQVTNAGRQGYSNLRTIMRSAYDFGSLFGMDFASDNSYSAIVDINICSMFCTTPSALDDYMDRKAIEGGNITRTLLCQLDDQIGADGALFKPYTAKQTERINSTLARVMADVYAHDGSLQSTKLLDTKWIDKDVRQWCTSKGAEALKSGSCAMDVFRKRASVSAFRTMALCYYLYLLDEVPISKAQARCRKIYCWMADYILEMLLRRWGKRFEELQAKREDTFDADTKRPRILDLLPQQFTREQLCSLLHEHQKVTPYRILLFQWKARKWIEELDNLIYRKTMKG